MNNVIPIPEGIDAQINQHQTLLYNRLSLLWGDMGLTADNFVMNGRCYRNKTDDGYLPQAFTAQGKKDYNNDMFFDDTVAAVMWYDLENETVQSMRHTYIVNMYGFVDLNKLKPDVTLQRMDNAVVNDVCKIGDLKYGFQFTDVYRDIDAVLQRYSGAIKNKTLTRDMQPFFGFRIRMKNTMLLNNCQSKAINYPRYQSAMTISYTAVFKDAPNTSLKQRLSNGVMAQMEFPTGGSVTIPYLAGKYILKGQLYNTSNVVLAYNDVTGTLTAPDGGFQNDDVLIIDVNVN